MTEAEENLVSKVTIVLHGVSLVTLEVALAAVRLERETCAKAAGWQSIETASKDAEILALSPAYDGPVVLRWFKYNGKEAWRDWDNDPHWPTHWLPLPEMPTRTRSVAEEPCSEGVN
jgi:hypothetical protein